MGSVLFFLLNVTPDVCVGFVFGPCFVMQYLLCGLVVFVFNVPPTA